jgi:hypothetical protein
MKQSRFFWSSISRGTRFQILFYGISAVFGVFFFLGPRIFANQALEPLFIGLGIAFTASSILGFAQRLFFFDDFRSEMDDLVSGSLSDYLSKHMFPFISEGIEKFYSDRNDAIREFSKYIQLEKNEIVIIGSSLKGILDPREEQQEKREFADLLRSKLEEKVRIRFLMTHPALAFLREDAEGRAKGAIKTEIIRTLNYLVGNKYSEEGMKSVGIPMKDIYLYHGTPTIFTIIVTDRMLINPYTYQANAYENFCFEISRRGHHNLYNKILSAHYRKPWDNDETRTALTNAIMDHINNITLADIFTDRMPDLGMSSSPTTDSNIGMTSG